MGAVEHVDRHFGGAAEFARQGPVGAVAVGQDAAEDTGARGGPGDLLDFLDRVDGIERDAEVMGARDITLLLDRVAERNAVGRSAGGERHFDFGHRSRVEARAESGEQRQHFGRRIGFHRIEDAGGRHRAGEAEIIVTDDLEVDDKAGALGSSVGEEVDHALRSHRRYSPIRAQWMALELAEARPPRWRRESGRPTFGPSSAMIVRARCASHSPRFVCLGLEGFIPSALLARKVVPLQ